MKGKSVGYFRPPVDVAPAGEPEQWSQEVERQIADCEQLRDRLTERDRMWVTSLRLKLVSGWKPDKRSSSRLETIWQQATANAKGQGDD